MKVWKIVSGILCMVFFGVVMLQSCATGVVNTVEANAKDTSASGGVILGILMLAGGIVSVATSKGGKGGHIATLVIFLLASLIGFANQGTFKDLVIWSVWCLICAILAIIGLFRSRGE